jgi:excisionase family DNA binding protein
MSFTQEISPRNRHDRRAMEAGHEPLAVPMARAPDWLGVSRTTIYQEIRAGRLKAKKCGAKTLLTYESGQAWLAALPDLAA